MDPNQCQTKIFEKRTANVQETMSDCLKQSDSECLCSEAIRRSNRDQQPRLLTSDNIQQCSSPKGEKENIRRGQRK